jgi:hypothetical protein
MTTTDTATVIVRRGLLSRLAYTVVLIVALTISWWSLYVLARHYAVPPWLAVGASTVFDGGALVLGDLSHRYAQSPDSGLASRLGMFALVAGSVYLNAAHAILMHYGTPAKVMFAAPAAVAGLLFELERGWTNRAARRRYGRVAEALSPVERLAWVPIVGAPFAALGTLRFEVRSRLDARRRDIRERYAAAVVSPMGDMPLPATNTRLHPEPFDPWDPNVLPIEGPNVTGPADEPSDLGPANVPPERSGSATLPATTNVPTPKRHGKRGVSRRKKRQPRVPVEQRIAELGELRAAGEDVSRAALAARWGCTPQNAGRILAAANNHSPSTP